MRIRKPCRVTTKRGAVIDGKRASHRKMPRARNRWNLGASRGRHTRSALSGQ